MLNSISFSLFQMLNSISISGVDVLSEPWYSSGIKIVLEPGEVLVVPKHWWHLVRLVMISAKNKFFK